MHISNELFTVCISISASGFVEMESQVKNQCWMKGGKYFSFPVSWRKRVLGRAEILRTFVPGQGEGPKAFQQREKSSSHRIQSKRKTKMRNKEVSIQIFCPLFAWVVCFLILSCRSCLYILQTNLWLPRREWGGGINWEIDIDMYALLLIKQIANKDLLYSTRISSQYSLMTYM